MDDGLGSYDGCIWNNFFYTFFWGVHYVRLFVAITSVLRVTSLCGLCFEVGGGCRWIRLELGRRTRSNAWLEEDL